MPSEQMDAKAQNHANAAVTRNNATIPYSSTNSANATTASRQATNQASPNAGAGTSSSTNGMANSNAGNLGTRHQRTARVPASRRAVRTEMHDGQPQMPL